MYDFIAGTVAARTGTSIVIDASGVGFELVAPLGSSFPAKGKAAKVWAHLVVREDAQMLFGFPRREDRNLFRILLKVRGVGPSMALAILSGLDPDELVGAVVHQEVKAFTRVRGVGKKTAEQILLDLRGKEALLLSAASADAVASMPTAPAADAPAPNVADAIAALVSIGFSEKDATKAVDAAAKEHGSDDLEGLVRAAMRR